MKATTRDAHRDVVSAVLRHVRDHPVGDLAALADVARLSPHHFHRVFRRLTGRTPDDHVSGLRLVRAAVALRTGMGPIVAIALAAGYANHESFSRAFRRTFGRSPADYRAAHRTGAAMNGMNPSVSLVKVPVTDFDRSRRFYRDVLGLDEELAVEAYGWAQYKTGGVPLCLYVVGRGGGDGTPGGEAGFHLGVDDARAAHALLKARGATLATDLVASDDGGTFFVVADPDGNTFKICQAV